MISTSILTEEYVPYNESMFIDTLMEDNLNMELSICGNLVRSILETHETYVTESFREKASKVIETLKNILKKVFTSIGNYLKETAEKIKFTLKNILKYKNFGIYKWKRIEYDVLKDNSTISDNIPKTIKDQIFRLDKMSVEELEKYMEDDENGNMKNAAEYAKNYADKIASECYKPIGQVNGTDELNSLNLIENKVDRNVTMTTVIIRFKTMLENCNKRVKALAKLGEDLTNSYNNELKSIDNMFNSKTPDDYSSEQARKDDMILTIAKIEYGALFHASGKVLACESRALKICSNKYDQTLQALMRQVNTGSFEDKKEENKEEKEND